MLPSPSSKQVQSTNYLLGTSKFKAQIICWEGKAELAGSDHCAIQHDVETFRKYDIDFKKNHFAIVELANEEELEAEQVPLDHHTDGVTEFSDYLLQLLPEPEKVLKRSPATTVADGLLKQLCYITYELTLVNDAVDLMTPGPGTNTCLL